MNLQIKNKTAVITGGDSGIELITPMADAMMTQKTKKENSCDQDPDRAPTN